LRATEWGAFAFSKCGSCCEAERSAQYEQSETELHLHAFATGSGVWLSVVCANLALAALCISGSGIWPSLFGLGSGLCQHQHNFNNFNKKQEANSIIIN
jgi:hypothetical protein